MDTNYLQHKEEIDEVLRINAALFTDPENTRTKTLRDKTKALERKNLREIKHLAPDFIEWLLKASD